MQANFNFIAPVYDILSKIMFGSTLLNAQKTFIAIVPDNAHVLILGGGSGHILPDILRSSENIHITYIEPSKKMLLLAKKKIPVNYNNRVTFILGNENAIPKDTFYTIVITFFVIDLFKQDEAIQFATKLKEHTLDNTLWLFADFFKTTNKWQQIILWFMFRFFKCFTSMSSSKLPNFDAIFSEINFKILYEKEFLNGFVKSRVYTVV